VTGAALWVLPEDGIVDWMAVEIAASGVRRVRLTVQERTLAAALILRRGGSAWEVARRLFISYSTARALVASVTATPPDLDEAA
jgi:hypothetical protein